MNRPMQNAIVTAAFSQNMRLDRPNNKRLFAATTPYPAKDAAHRVGKRKTELNLVIVSVADLGFGERGASLADGYARAAQLGPVRWI